MSLVERSADATGYRSLLAWLDRPAAGRGIRFAGDCDSWDLWSYERLASLARSVARGLAAGGVGAGDVVVLVLRSGPEFVGALFGTVLAGAAASPASPPMAFQHPAAYRDDLYVHLAAARPVAVLTSPSLAGAVQAAAAGTRVLIVSEVLSAGAAGEPEHVGNGADPEATALLQFTAGSSGRARGVRVPRRALEANVAAIGDWLRLDPKDAVASWLPVHHDMGLVGCLLTPVAHQTDLWLLQPEQFIRHPLRYLRCFGQAGAALSAMPGFGLDHIVRRVEPTELAGMDFSPWRALILGAERIDPRSLERFGDLLGPFGLRPGCLLPAYGLAEATLAVTGVSPAAGWRAVEADPASLSPGLAVRLAPAGRAGTRIVGCGRPLGDSSVAILGESSEPLPERFVGEIAVRGPCLASGYAGGGSASLTRFAAGQLRTGDAGFLLDGELFVLGRLGDSVKVRGRAVFAEELEAALRLLPSPPRRLAAALGWHRGGPTVAVVFEGSADAWREEARLLLEARTPGAAIVLVEAPRGAIPRTTSGKVRRRRLWRALVEGELGDAALG